MKLINKQGSMTVEASLIFPIIFLVVITIIYICLLLYEKIYIQSIADDVVQRGTHVWSNIYKNIELGNINKLNLKSGGLYWRLYDCKGNEKKQILEQYINEKLNSFSILSKTNETKVTIKNYIFYKKLIVSIQSTYKIPVGKFIKLFGLDENYIISVHSEAVINEPVEFIRNTDFVLDIQKNLEKKYPGYGEMVEKIRDTMNELHDKIAELNFNQ